MRFCRGEKKAEGRWTGLAACSLAHLLAAGTLLAALSVATAAETPKTAEPAAAPTGPVSAPEPPRPSAKQTLEAGKKLELVGKFQEAYNLYALISNDSKLPGSARAADLELIGQIKQRYTALQYLAHEPQIKTGESVYWIPKNQAELDEGKKKLQAEYAPFRKACAALADMMMPVAQATQEKPDRAAYEAKAGQALDAYVQLVAQATKEQIAGHCFQQLLAAVQSMTNATRNWDAEELRKIELARAFKYFEALKERVEQDPFGDALWQRHGRLAPATE
jgi:hypothetical protein